MTDDDPPFDFARLRAVREAKTGNLGDLVLIAGLDPKTDFRFADWRSADWEGTDRDAFDLEGAETGGATPQMRALMERQRLLGEMEGASKWKDRRDAARALLAAHPEDGTIHERIAARMLTDRSRQFAEAMLEALDRLDLPALRPDEFGAFLKRAVSTSGRRDKAVSRWIAFGRDPGRIDWVKTLDVSRTRLSDVSVLSGLSSLQHLSLWGTGVSEVSALSGLSSLEWLDLDDTGVTDVSALDGIPGLTIFIGPARP